MADSPGQFRGQARLPRFAAPRRYELRLRPDLVACTFSGSAAVAVDVSAPTRFVVLNAADLAVDRNSISFQDLAPTEVSLFEDDEILVLGFGKELPLGEGVLRMDFNGTLNDQIRGFYRSKYEYKGETKNMAVMQFGKSNQGKFALDVGVKSLDLYKDYFDTPYPLPKLDMVAIPDFAAGAMENYGLVTFQEVALFFDEQSSIFISFQQTKCIYHAQRVV